MVSRALDTHLANNTLSCVVFLAVGKRITVELRNEAYATGVLDEVDGLMNCTLSKVSYANPMGVVRSYDFLFVPNRIVRFVQIPPEIDIRSSLKDLFSSAGTRSGNTGSRTSRNAGGAIELSRARKHILAMKEQRRREDLDNAMKMRRELLDRK